MAVLVTGGAGYIGSHTSVALIEAGFEVVVVDNFCNSKRYILDRIEQITGKSVRFYEVDVCDENGLSEVFSDSGDIESVIHFAALKSVGESIEFPEKYINNNIGGTEVLLKVMAHHGVSKLVFSSSCTVYGQPEIIPVDESSPFLPPESPYGFTKQACEEIITKHSSNTNSSDGFSSAILRYFNPIGAHPSGLIGELPLGIPNNLVPFLTQTVAGLRDSLVVFGDDYPTPDGSCIRDYLHICDLADAHLAALKNIPSGVRSYNLGTGKGASVLEIIADFKKATSMEVPHEIGPRRKGDIVQIWADPSRAEKELNWKARRSKEDALTDAWRWQQNLNSAT